jgi:hypothetical protein
MKRILLALGAMSLLLACGDDDSGSSYDLSTASIANASIIYKRAATTRAANGSDEDEGYWKIDRHGNETRILLYDKAGNPTDVKIEKIEKLNDKLLLIETNSYPLRMIADLQTEKLYQAPDVLDTPVKEGPDGMLYFVGKWIDAVNNQMLYKLDPKNFTIEQVLPDGQKCNDFLINKGNTIYYTEASLINSGGKFKMPSGRIYPTDGVIFLAGDNDFYSIDYDRLYISKWNQKSNNELEKMTVCPLYEEGLPDQFPREIISIVKNEKSNNTIIFMPIYADIPGQTGYKLYEFDGSRIVRTITYDHDNNELHKAISIWWEIGTSQKESLANDYLFFTGSEILTLNLDDYSIKSTPYTFPASEYELYETTMDEANKRQLFTALRYEDGKVVIGEISAQGRISIINEKESSNKIINLIALN